MARRKTPEEVAWLESEYPKAPTPDVAAAFEERFGWPLPAERINDWASGRGLRKLHRALRWADHPEYDGFLREFTAGHSEREIIAAFRERFGVTLTEAQLGNRKAKLGLRSGTAGGRFEKGNVPHNKGRTWDELGIPEESRRRMRGASSRRARSHGPATCTRSGPSGSAPTGTSRSRSASGLRCRARTGAGS